MAKRSKVPTREEHARVWASLPGGDRRRIFRAVNRGETLPSRKEARIAVGAARQQLRYWRKAWWFGPLMGLVFLPEWSTVVLASVMGTGIMGAMSWHRMRRAARAEQGNLERIGAQGR